jgi:hypothetical protein
MSRTVNLSWAMIIIMLVMVATAMPSAAAEPSSEQRQVAIYFKRMAVAPFLVGHRQPQMDSVMDDTLSCPLNQICSDDPSIAPEAGMALTRLVQEAMAQRFGNRLVPSDEIDAGYTALRINSAQDTPRTLARQLGQAVSADLMVIGAVWRFRERDPLEGVPDIPASVAFALYLVEVETGRQLWRGLFNGTQEFATQNIFNLSKQLKMGTRWLSAAELARHGVKEALSTFPKRIMPNTNASNTSLK